MHDVWKPEEREASIKEDQSKPLQFEGEQKQALDKIQEWLDNESLGNEFKLGGIAGSGKSTILRELIRRIGFKYKHRVVSSTGRSVALLRNKGIHFAETMHSLLYEKTSVDPQTGDLQFVKRPKLDCKLIICDEAGPLNLDVYTDAKSYNLRYLWIGDHWQLKPIGENPHLMDNPDVRLEEPRRQGKGSNILKFAIASKFRKAISYGKVSEVEIVRPDAFWKRIYDPTFDQIIVGFNDTRHRVNIAIRNDRGYIGVAPRPGEKIICLQTNKNKGIYNGQMFKVLHSDTCSKYILMTLEDELGEIYEDIKAVPSQFGKNRLGFAEMKALKDPELMLFDYAFAITTFKAQGGEYGKLLAYEECHPDWDIGCLSYTTITRAQNEIVYAKQFRRD